jgi:DNA-binding transcriptional regulator YdaS (Cro superfamily)
MLTFIVMESTLTPPDIQDRLVAAKYRAIEIVGGVPRLAERLGVKRQAIYQWSCIPAGRVGQVGSMTGLAAHELRPDIFPPPVSQVAEAGQ